MNIDPDILWYYGRGREQQRLSNRDKLEEARTRHILAKRLTDTSLSIVDVGGGPGAYAFWLSDMGHAVTLVDPVPLHIEQARTHAADSGITLSNIVEADARNLPFEDQFFDVALMFGPLYHLIDRTDRVAALREAGRVMRRGGTLFAVAISRYGAAVDGFFKGFASHPGYAEMIRGMMATGTHSNPLRQSGLFTTSYVHRVDELADELAEAGFPDADMLAIEGPWGCIPDFDQKWEHEPFRNQLMATIEAMESDPSVVGFGGHIMGVASKP